MKITAAQLHLLLTVVEQGSIGKAASLIGLTQSAASQALQTLEKNLGIQLVTRINNGVTPTAFTLDILANAQSVIDGINQIEHQAINYQALAKQPKQQFSIASIPSIAQNLLPLWSKQLKQLYPHLPISFFQGSHIEVGEWVMSGMAEVGLTSVIPEKAHAVLIHQEPLLVVVALNNRLATKPRISLIDLLDLPIITVAGCELVVANLFKEQAITPPKLIKIQDITTALKMTRQNLGVTILPEASFPRSDIQHLHYTKFTPTISRNLYLISSKTFTEQAITKQFIQIIKQKDN